MVNRIILPVLKNIEGTTITNENDTLESILPKLKEEYEEFIEAVQEDHPIEHKLEEFLDLVQTCVRVGKVFIKEGNDLESASKVHVNKLRGRGWNFENHIDIYFESK